MTILLHPKFLKSREKPCLPIFHYRCTLELDLLTIETGNTFTGSIPHLHGSIKEVVGGRQSDYCVFLGISY